jgi:hypothetical protein
MSKAKDEIKKAEERGQPLSKAGVALETAREKLHAKKGDKATAKAFKAASAKVHAERKAAREKRQAEGPPEAAAGDAVVRLGGPA